MSITYHEGYWFDSNQRRRLFFRDYQPKSFLATVVLLHGFGEYGGRHELLAQRLSQAQIRVLMPDLWGHGQTEGKRGDLGSLQDCVESLNAWLSDQLRYTGSQSPVYLMGHSFGCLVALKWVAQEPIWAGLIVQAPLIGVGFSPPRWKTLLAKGISQVLPAVTLPMGLNVADLSRSHTSNEAYRQDPLVHDRMSARTYVSMVEFQSELALITQLKVPLLALWGQADHIIHQEKVADWFDRIQGNKVKYVFEQAKHELHCETDDVPIQVAKKIMEFIGHVAS